MALAKRRYNNGIESRLFRVGEPIPDGWVPGFSQEEKRARAEKTRQTNLARYGVENPFQSEEIKEKIRRSNQERYGVDNPSQSAEIQDRVKKTNLERFGTEYASQSEEIRARIKRTTVERHGGYSFQSPEIRARIQQTILARYGVNNPSQSESIKQKKRETALRHFGVENPQQSEIVRSRVRQTNLARYGVEYVFQADSVKDKIRQTNQERYGVEYASQSEEIKEKARQTSQERYGTDHPMQSEEVQERTRRTVFNRYGVENLAQLTEIQDKIKQTNFERYGVENPSQAEEIKRKKEQTTLEHYGVLHPLQSPEIREKVRQTNIQRYGVENPSQLEEIKKKVSATCREHYGVNWPCQRPEYRASHGNNSRPNREFAQLLSSQGIEFEREFSVGNYSYDFRVGNILIEINPYATHNTLWNPYGAGGVSETYHQSKSQIALEAGFHCIHVFDWDDTSKIISLLKSRSVIYARKCEICEVSVKECDEFLNLYHLQNTCKGQAVRLGLYYNGELVSVMTFGKPRYNRNFQWELLRYCSIKNITGGAERLFKMFVRCFNPLSIISYCDYSKFQGRVYDILGFKVKRGVNPSKHWYSPKEQRHITDNFLRQRGFDQIFDEHYGKGTSNEELMIQRGYFPVFDCGQGVYYWSES